MPGSDFAVDGAGVIERGWVHLAGPYPTRQSAWTAARAVCNATTSAGGIGAGLPELSDVGEFTVPPNGAVRRDFQTLHIDFGLPINAGGPADIARFTALYIDNGHQPTTAQTRIVVLRRLLSQREWVDSDVLDYRLREYGRRSTGSETYVEGILARLVEAADGSESLPAVRAPGFLCGTEFGSRDDERDHLARRGLDLDTVEELILIGPGEVVVFDNLATAHGRLGMRAPQELAQLCIGYRRLGLAEQDLLMKRVLSAFAG